MNLSEIQLFIPIDIQKLEQIFDSMLAQLKLVFEAVRLTCIKFFDYFVELLKVYMLQSRYFVLQRVHTVT